jgi:hypothetical protein
MTGGGDSTEEEEEEDKDKHRERVYCGNTEQDHRVRKAMKT